MMIAAFSDGMGRRPAYIACFTIYMAANLGLGLQNSYAALLVLRMLQSAGSSGTIALANGLVGDLVTSSERGQYVSDEASSQPAFVETNGERIDRLCFIGVNPRAVALSHHRRSHQPVFGLALDILVPLDLFGGLLCTARSLLA